MLSGTLNVTRENLHELLDLVSSYGLPLVVEPASPPDCAIFDNGIDHLFVPSVLNTNDVRWVVGKHYAWLRQASSIDWEMVVPEAYIVLNPNSAVGRVTGGADCSLSGEDVAAFAQVADRYFRFPIVYIEYSGTYGGDPAIVQAASEAIEHATLYYAAGSVRPSRRRRWAAMPTRSSWGGTRSTRKGSTCSGRRSGRYNEACLRSRSSWSNPSTRETSGLPPG